MVNVGILGATGMVGQRFIQLLDNHPDFEITHVHLNDGTVAGMRMKSKNCFSVQYHPEASPGPHDSSYLFDQFITNIETSKN